MQEEKTLFFFKSFGMNC